MTEAKKYETMMLYTGAEIEGDTMHPDASAIYPATAYRVMDTRDYDKKNAGEGFFYSRSRNPNRESLAEAISFLEKGEKTIICSSGMAAVSTPLIALLKQGDHVVASNAIYGETIEVFDILLGKFGVEATYVDFSDLEAVKAAIRPNTKILYTEVISNPMISVVDIREISKIAKSCNALFIIDNTFSTPYVINPLTMGADIVVHSLTKFINGHSDVTGGSITASAEIIDSIMHTYYMLGGCLDANSSWLALRSIRTFGLRMQKSVSNAQALAEALEKDPRVRNVNYPGLPSHPQHNIAKEMFPNGAGPMISFLMEDDRDKVDDFMHRLNMVQYLGTLGGYRTSVAHPATGFRTEFTPEQLVEMGMTEGLIRISVGVEEPEDIINDIISALDAFGTL